MSGNNMHNFGLTHITNEIMSLFGVWSYKLHQCYNNFIHTCTCTCILIIYSSKDKWEDITSSISWCHWWNAVLILFHSIAKNSGNIMFTFVCMFH